MTVPAASSPAGLQTFIHHGTAGPGRPAPENTTTVLRSSRTRTVMPTTSTPEASADFLVQEDGTIVALTERARTWAIPSSR